MKEELVTFETAKLLKALGFDWSCRTMYNYKGEKSGTKMGMKGNPNNYIDYYSAPTQSLAQKWLIDVKGFVVNIDIAVLDEYFYTVRDLNSYTKNNVIKPSSFSIEGFEETYEQALESGLLASLKLIKNGKRA